MKPIKLTPEIREDLIAQFARELDTASVFDGEFKLSK